MTLRANGGRINPTLKKYAGLSNRSFLPRLGVGGPFSLESAKRAQSLQIGFTITNRLLDKYMTTKLWKK